jgi:hypothetical protein
MLRKRSCSSCSCPSYSAGATVHDEPWPLLRHWSRSFDIGLQFITHIYFQPSATACSHMTAGLPTRWVPSGTVSLIYRDTTSRKPSRQWLGRFGCENTISLTHGDEPFLGTRQLCSNSRTSQHFTEPEGSLPSWQDPSSSPYLESYQTNPYHPILSL